MPTFAWVIEEYHREMKQWAVEPNVLKFVPVARERNHIGLSIRAFLRLELNCFATGISWYEAKLALVLDAVRAYLAAPRFSLAPTA